MPAVGVNDGGAGPFTYWTSLSPNLLPQFNIGSSNNCQYWWPSSSHTNALVVGLGDASVRFISNGMSQNTFNIAMVPSDGLPMPSDW